jgi:RsiW-degrading membrane proteinase PrsW (M82 family)
MTLSYVIGRKHLYIPYDMRRIGIYTVVVVTLLAIYYGMNHLISLSSWGKMGVGTLLFIIYCIIFYKLDFYVFRNRGRNGSSHQD